MAADHSALIAFETKRLVVNHATLDDIPFIFSMASDKDVTKMFCDGQPKALEQVHGFVSHAVEDRAQSQSLWNGRRVYSAFLRETNEFIGALDSHLAEEDTSLLELGYMLRKEHWSKGFGSEASLGFINWVSAERSHQPIPIRGIFATAHPQNIPSCKILEKCGMKMQKQAVRFNNPRNFYYLIFPVSS